MIILRPGKNDSRFPPVEAATPEGLLAVGGDLSSDRLLEAYRHGIFPWYNPGQPILWWSPDPRAVAQPAEDTSTRTLHNPLRYGLPRGDAGLRRAARQFKRHLDH